MSVVSPLSTLFGSGVLQDMDVRKKAKQMELVWRGSQSYGDTAEIFTGNFPSGILLSTGSMHVRAYLHPTASAESGMCTRLAQVAPKMMVHCFARECFQKHGCAARRKLWPTWGLQLGVGLGQ